MLKITSDNFDKEVKESGVPVLVDFWASWCGPCQMLGPIFEKVSKEFPEDKIRFGKCSTEEEGELAAQNSVMSIPCMILFKGGKEVDRIVGAMQEADLKAKVEEMLK